MKKKKKETNRLNSTSLLEVLKIEFLELGSNSKIHILF